MTKITLLYPSLSAIRSLHLLCFLTHTVHHIWILRTIKSLEILTVLLKLVEYFDSQTPNNNKLFEEMMTDFNLDKTIAFNFRF